MRVIGIGVGDEDGARRAASDLLAGALEMRAAGEPSGQPAIGYRAGWIGSPIALGAFGVHRDAEVASWDLAALLQGRHVRNGDPVSVADGRSSTPDLPAEPPHATSFVIEIPVPEALAREHRRATPERKAEIERAAIESAEVSLEHARQVVPAVPHVVEGIQTMHVTTGIPALAIVRPPDEHAELRVEAVVPAVEWSDGTLGAPNDRVMLLLEIFAATRGLEHARRVTAAVERSREPPTPRPVGRGNAWVTDPLDAWRPQPLRRIVRSLHELRIGSFVQENLNV